MSYSVQLGKVTMFRHETLGKLHQFVNVWNMEINFEKFTKLRTILISRWTHLVSYLCVATTYVCWKLGAALQNHNVMKSIVNRPIIKLLEGFKLL